MSKKDRTKNNKQTKQTTLYASGMHCASCEILIEKKLLSFEHIHAADVSMKDGSVTIVHDAEEGLKFSKLQNAIAEFDYELSRKKITQKTIPLFSFANGNLRVNTDKATKYGKGLLVVIGMLILFYIVEKAGFGKYVSVDSNSTLPAFFVLGIVAGLSSCAALIGGLLLSMTKQWNELYIDDDTKQKKKPHFMFHIGRLVSFFALGGTLGILGETISLDNPVIFSTLTIIVSIVMAILGLQMLGVSWAERIRITAPKFLTRFAANEKGLEGEYMPFAIGALTFFLPCGFTLVAQSIALTSGGFWAGGLIMLLFALGTLPTLLSISFSGIIFNKKPHLTAQFNLVAGLLIIFFVVYNINGQLNVLGFPSLSDVIQKSQTTSPNEQAVEVVDGAQVLRVTASGFSYIPTSSMTLVQNIPAKLIVDNQGVQGCGSYIAAKGLFEGYRALTPGENIIEFVPRKGTYKLTCSMGMVPPVTIKVQ